MATETLMLGAAGWAVMAGALAATGAVAGVLAGLLGVGGGIVIVPVLYHVFTALGIDEAVRMHLAVGTSLATIVPTSIRSAAAHRAKGSLDMALLKQLLPGVVVGVAVGALASGWLDGRVLTAVFAVVALLVAAHMALGDRAPTFGHGLPGRAGCAALGGGIGGLSTLMGIGGGVLNNTFMTLFGRPMHQAVATSSGVGVLIAIPGTIGYIWAGWGDPLLPVASTGFINWIAVALIIPIALVVTPYGVRIAHALKKRQLEIGFGLFCIFVSVRFFLSLI